MLGILSNEKPSAVYKLGLKSKLKSTLIENQVTAQVGISIEPIDIVQRQLNEMNFQNSESSTFSSNDPQHLVGRILENFYNHCASYSQMIPAGAVNLFGTLDWGNAYIEI
jgi:hypothetical protein